jgi:single-strand DNA-binding protein
MSRSTAHGSSRLATAEHLVLIQGVLSSDAVARELPSGQTVVNLEVTSGVGSGQRVSVPVVADAAAASFGRGDPVLVLGVVRRRFYRAGGVTASRTEVVAETVVRGGDRRRTAGVLDRARRLLATSAESDR